MEIEINSENNLCKRFNFSTHEGQISIEIDKIMFIKGSGSYSQIHIEDEVQSICISQNLGFFQKNLKTENFLRCHKSWLVNVFKISSWYHKKKLLYISNFGIPVSRRKWRKVCSILSNKGIKPAKMLSLGITNLRPEIKYDDL